MFSSVEGTLLITPEVHLPLAISHPRTSERKQDYSCNLKFILSTPPPSHCGGNCGAGKDGVTPCVDLQAGVGSSGVTARVTAKLCSWPRALVLSTCSCCLKKFLQGGGNDVAQVGASNGLNFAAGFPRCREKTDKPILPGACGWKVQRDTQSSVTSACLRALAQLMSLDKLLKVLPVPVT